MAAIADVSVKDVTSRAGVSFEKGTKVLNGKGTVSAQTRARLLTAAEDLDRLLNTLARVPGAEAARGPPDRDPVRGAGPQHVALSLRPGLPTRRVPERLRRAGLRGATLLEVDEPTLHFANEGPTFDELNAFTDMLGRRGLLDPERAPGELSDRFDDPACRDVRQEMVEVLLTWTIRTEDDLPGGQYTSKRADRNWYAPHR